MYMFKNVLVAIFFLNKKQNVEEKNALKIFLWEPCRFYNRSMSNIGILGIYHAS